MKLEEGMYVRTEIFGRIGKYLRNDKECPFSYIVIVDDKNCEYTIPRETIKVASNNIIDLIEVGDYVNGYYVEDVKETFINVATGSNYFQSPTIYEEQIKSIVTKEQFSQMEYKVGE